MQKLVVFALLGMLALASALDAETQKKKDYKYDEKEYKHEHKANVEAKHKEWDLAEDVIATHPCDRQYEIFGSTVAQSAKLLNKREGKLEAVGSVTWSGVVAQHEQCEDCKGSTLAPWHTVKINYEVIFEFEKEHKGQIVTGAVAGSILSDETVELAVLGGTGAFEGAWGTITWSAGSPHGKYAFDIYLPKVHKKDYYGEEYKEGKYDDKYEKYEKKEKYDSDDEKEYYYKN